MPLGGSIAVKIALQLVAERNDAEQLAPAHLALAARIEILNRLAQFEQVGSHAIVLIHRAHRAIEKAVGHGRCSADLFLAHAGDLIDLFAKGRGIGVLGHQIGDKGIDFLVQLRTVLVAHRDQPRGLFERDRRDGIRRRKVQFNSCGCRRFLGAHRFVFQFPSGAPRQSCVCVNNCISVIRHRIQEFWLKAGAASIFRLPKLCPSVANLALWQRGMVVTEGTAAPLGSPKSSFSRVLFSWRRWWRQDVVGTVDQAEVIADRREDCHLSERYLFMTAMSGGIAILGMLLSSPAVVIGAMLLSPLMGPIIGLGFALAIGDYRWLKDSARSLAWGTLMAVVLCALIVYFSPIQTVTSEIAARTRPNLFDLLVALFSAMAGAYAMIRGREGTIVGVAIATALMPPLAVVGFGLATFNWTVFSGALLLYVTNLLTIALVAWAMARLYGFRTSLTERQSLFQNLVVVSAFVALAVPLFFSLQKIAWETNAQRVGRSELTDAFGDRSRISQVDFDWTADPIAVEATVFTPQLLAEADRMVREAVTRRLGRPRSE